MACLPAAKAAGFEGIDVVLAPGESGARLADALAAHGLRAGGAGLPMDFRAADADFAANLARLPQIATTAVAAGCTRFYTWVAPVSDRLPFKENFAFHVARLTPIAAVLARHGCRLGLEFIGPKTCRDGHRYYFIHAMAGMLDLCAAVGENTGLLLDSWHWFTSLGTVEEIRTLRPAQVVYVHINDAPAGIAVERQQDSVRCLPGDTGVEDLPGFLAALRDIGYDGPVVPEPFLATLKQLPAAEAIARTGAALGKVWSLPPRPALPATMQVVATGRQKAWLVTQPVPRPQGHEVVVKLHVSPICGSNLGGFLGDSDCVNSGHEGAGEVVAVAQSNRLRVGDRVVLAPINACGCCVDCQRGDTIMCSNRPAIYGNFAQFTRVADVNCTIIPPDIDYVHASLLGCGLGPASEALKRLGVRAYDTVVITGLGPVGLGAVALATFMGARVIGIDVEPYRLNVARKLGADLVLEFTDPQLAAKLRDATRGRGIEKGIDCSGKDAAERLLLDLAATRGMIAFVGENQKTIPISPSNDFIRKNLSLLGCWHMPMTDVPALFEFLRRAPEKADLLISHRFPFSRVQEAFTLFASRQSAKVVLLPWE
jgi:threonine dehydrogenase-like Zn-dependent dehydrogenase/sugar phosphate isomerase/epimerase